MVRQAVVLIHNGPLGSGADTQWCIGQWVLTGTRPKSRILHIVKALNMDHFGMGSFQEAYCAKV
jgi:hypothetical protein